MKFQKKKSRSWHFTSEYSSGKIFKVMPNSNQQNCSQIKIFLNFVKTVYWNICINFIYCQVARWQSPSANAGDSGDSVSNFGSGKSPGVENGTPVFLLGKFHEQRSLAATVYAVTKSQTPLSTHLEDDCLCTRW